MTLSDVASRMQADLSRSGLTVDDMPVVELESDETYSLCRKRIASYAINYPSFFPDAPEFYRLRFLEEATGDDGRPLRYWQPPNTPVRAFFPPGFQQAFFGTPGHALTITEGEKKAACAMKHGLPCVGLGGVFNYRTATGQLIPDLSAFVWEGRFVTLVYDSDGGRNALVRQAGADLAQRLVNLGAVVRTVYVPALSDNGKQGLDDWLVRDPEGAKTELCRISAHGSLVDPDDAIWRLNEEMAFIEESGAVWSVAHRKFFSTHQWVERTRNHALPTGDGKTVPAYHYFITHLDRRTHTRVTYDPAHYGEVNGTVLNLYRPGHVKAVPEDTVTKRLEAFFAYAFPDRTEREWFLDWCAYPLKHPGTKHTTAAVLVGVDGVGKTLVGRILEAAYGEANVAWVTGRDLKSPYTSAWAYRQLIVGEEIAGFDSFREMDYIKLLVTQHVQAVEEKYQPKLVLPDFRNFLFVSNHALPFLLSRTDRRFFVHEFPTAKWDKARYGEVYDAIRKHPDAVLAWLGARDVSGFNPSLPPPMTVMKEEMIHESLTDFERWLERTVERKKTPDVWTTDDLRLAFDPTGKTSISARKILQAARALPTTAILRGVEYGDDSVTLVAIRNGGEWKKKDKTAWLACYKANPPF